MIIKVRPIITVRPGDDVQAAFDRAVPGDEILFDWSSDPDYVFEGPYYFPSWTHDR